MGDSIKINDPEHLSVLARLHQESAAIYQDTQGDIADNLLKLLDDPASADALVCVRRFVEHLGAMGELHQQISRRLNQIRADYDDLEGNTTDSFDF